MNYSHLGRSTRLELIDRGPLVEVALMPAPAIRSQPGFAMQPFVTKLMIDTGAQKTVIENSIALALGLVPLRWIPMVGVSQKEDLCPLYLMSIAIACADHRAKKPAPINAEFTAEVIGGPDGPIRHDHSGLLGRDFLANFRLTYDGPSGTYEVHIPDAMMHAVRKATRTGKP